jgi:hypothetical protein
MRHTAYAIGAVLVLACGCIVDSDDDDCCPRDDGRAPHSPVGVTSTTADHAVYLDWYPNQETDLDGYRVYVSPEPHGPYEILAFTRDPSYVHQRLRNGITYYYAVSAIDIYGWESDLNDEIVFDTPRPEGFGLILYEADGDDADRSGYDFSRYRRLHWEASGTDLFYDRFEGAGYLAVPDFATDIQDAGFADFDDVTWAPDGGWTETGYVEAIPGHVYVVWTRDNHFAKVRVVATHPDWIKLDWAYQVDKGNPELIRPGAGAARPRPGHQP